MILLFTVDNDICDRPWCPEKIALNKLGDDGCSLWPFFFPWPDGKIGICFEIVIQFQEISGLFPQSKRKHNNGLEIRRICSIFKT